MLPVSDRWLSPHGDWNFMILQTLAIGEYSYGNDLAYTRGPLLFLMYPKIALDGALYAGALFFHIAVNILFLLGCWCFFKLHMSKRAALGITLLLALGSLPQISYGISFIRYLMPIPMLAFCQLNNRLTGGVFISLFIAALAATHLLITFSHGLMASASFYTFILFLFFKRRRLEALIASSAHLCTLITLWRLSAGPDSSFLEYAKGSLLISSAYNEVQACGSAMILFIPQLVGGACWLMAGVTGLRTRSQPVVSLFLLLTPTLFYFFKHGWVRASLTNVYEPFFTFSIALLMAWLIFRKAPLIRSRMAAITTLSGGLIMGATSTVLAIYLNLYGPVSFMGLTLQSATRLLHDLVLITRPDERLSELAINREEMRSFFPVPKEWLDRIGANRIVALPQHSSILYAHDLNWTVQPSVFSYIAWCPYVDDKDYAFYLDESPDYILWFPSTIDDQNPVWFSPKALQYIRLNYDVVETSGPVLLLQRRTTACAEKARILARDTARLNEAIDVPPTQKGSSVFFSAELGLRWWGKLTGALFRLDPIRVYVEMSDGSVEVYRFVRQNAPRGMLLSAQMQNEFFTRNRSPDCSRVVKVSVKAPWYVCIFFKQSFAYEIAAKHPSSP